MYDQLAEVQQKKKFHETKQQAQAYRARMNAFQTTLNKKKTNNNKKQQQWKKTVICLIYISLVCIWFVWCDIIGR